MGIVLLTDFGEEDGFVGVMKGVIQTIAPKSNIIDLAHQVPNYDILRGAILLEAHYKYFPKGTIFVCVIDPGVGTERQAIVVKSKNYCFVAPHNGVLDLVTAQEDIEACVSVQNQSYMLSRDNNTFHGRDIFAPVAAHLANGVSMLNMGEEIEYDWQLNYPFSTFNNEEKTVSGEIIGFDKYGNALTNIKNRNNITSGKLLGQNASFCHSFEEGRERIPNLINGSFGRVEVFLPESNARQLLHLKKGDEVTVFLQ